MSSNFQKLFGSAPEVAGEAPGRIEFIGNHTDYNGGMVMGVALNRRIRVEVSLRLDDRILLHSEGEHEAVELSLDSISKREGETSWANYPLGVFVVLREIGMKADNGFNMLITSDLPPGAGLSSSAALELSTAVALTQLYKFPLDKASLARVGRRAENEFVGVPCGILDQGVSAFGEADKLVRIDCAVETFSTLPMPKGLKFWIFNTLEKHSLVESLYATRHRECREAFEILRECGSNAEHLAHVTPAEVGACSKLPEILRKRALHIVEENERVKQMSDALKQGNSDQIGRLLYASHESSRTLFENSTEQLDALVSILKRRKDVMGARLTGGGFGGAVMALTGENFGAEEASEVASEFKRLTSHEPAIFNASSGDGARVVG